MNSYKIYELLKGNILVESKTKYFKHFFIMTSLPESMLSERLHCKDNVHLCFPLFFFLRGNYYSIFIALFFFFCYVVNGTRTHKSDLMKVLVSVKVYNKEAKLAEEVGDIFYYANIFLF